MLSYEDQLRLKRDVVVNAYKHFSGAAEGSIPDVEATIGSPLQYGYRTKITPHFDLPGGKGKEKAQPAPRRAPSVKPPESNFEPDLPEEVTRETRSTIAKSARASLVPEVLKEVRPTVQAIVEEEEEDNRRRKK